MRQFLIALGFVCTVTASSPATAAVLTINNGVLMGASGVNVNGTLWDVEFIDGTCIALFSGCDEVTDFTFVTEATALAASQALLDQVFVGVFDLQPELTNGCSDTSQCYAYTPYGLAALVTISYAANLAGDTNDSVGAGGGQHQGADWSNYPERVYALWTEAAEVPEPASVSLLALALAAVGGMRRRRAKLAQRRQPATAPV